MPQQVPENPGAEGERWSDPPPPLDVKREARPDGDDAYPGDVRRRRPLPLAQGQVGDLVAGGGEALGQIAVPAFGPADRVRKEAVVDEGDSHQDRTETRVMSRRALPARQIA